MTITRRLPSVYDVVLELDLIEWVLVATIQN
jgi:hypothetical protein